MPLALQTQQGSGQEKVEMAGKWSHRATFECSPLSARQAREFVSRRLAGHGLDYLVEPVRLVTSELVTNAVLHAQTAFRVSLAGSERTVLLTVSDDSQSLPARRAARATDASGRGLEIVSIVSLEWGVNEDASGSKGVWASFPIQGPRDF